MLMAVECNNLIKAEAGLPFEETMQSESSDNKFSTANFMLVSSEAMNFQLGALYPVHAKKEPVRINLLFLNHDRNFSTFLTIKYLVEHQRVADIYTLSRSMFESIISMGLLAKNLVADDIERYKEFQYLEIYKNYAHLAKLGLERLSGLAASDAKVVSDRRSDYVKKWGKKESSWTSRSLEDNVKTVDGAYPPTCNESHFYEYLYCQVYRKGSRSTHSSFAGLSSGVNIESIILPGAVAKRFTVNEGNLIFSCFHSLLVFLSSVRFLGLATGKTECETYFQKMANYVISEN